MTNPTPGLMVASMMLALDREQHVTWCDPMGARWCRRNRVGRLRDQLGTVLPPNVVPIVASADEGAKREAVQFLESHCRACGLCKLGAA